MLVFALISLWGFWECLTTFKNPVWKFLMVLISFIPAMALAYKVDQLLTMTVAVLCAAVGSVIVTTPKQAKPTSGTSSGV